jgi:hypothetical protein
MDDHPSRKPPVRFEQPVTGPFLVWRFPGSRYDAGIATLAEAVDEFVRYSYPARGDASIEDVDGVIALAYSMCDGGVARWWGVEAAWRLLADHRLVHPLDIELIHEQLTGRMNEWQGA